VVWHLCVWAILTLLWAPVLPAGPLPPVLLGVLLAAPMLELMRRFRGGGGYPGVAVRVWLLRPFWYGQALAPPVAALGLVAALVGLPFGAAGTAGRWASALAALALAGLAVIGYAGSRRLDVRELEAAWPDLAPELDGLRIAHLSDLHLGPHIPRGWLRRVRAAVVAARPDLVAVTGDLVDDFAPDADVYAAAFGDLDPPLGVWIVPGNHDVYAGWHEVRQRLERLPVHVLVNRARVLSRGGARLAIAGTGDPAGRSRRARGADDAGPDIASTMRDVPPGTFTIVLAHNPVLWPELARAGAHLTLSGHTHWGQFARPRRGWSLASPFLEHAMDRIGRDGRLLYISPGTGYWGIPFRIGAWPQVAVITLRRGAGGWDVRGDRAATGESRRAKEPT